MIGLVNVARSVILQSVHFQLLRREEFFRTMHASVVSGVVVRSLDVGGELVFQVELLAAEAPLDRRILLMFSFHMVFQAFVPRKSCGTECAVNLLSKLFRNVFAHVSDHIALQKRSEFTFVAKESLHFEVHFVDMSLQLVFIVRVTAQVAVSPFVKFLTTSPRFDEAKVVSCQLRRRELLSFVEMILLDDIAVQILGCESVVDSLDLVLHLDVHSRVFMLVFYRHRHLLFVSFFIEFWISQLFDDPVHKSIEVCLLVDQLFAKIAEAPELVVTSLAYYTRVAVVSSQLKGN